MISTAEAATAGSENPSSIRQPVLVDANATNGSVVEALSAAVSAVAAPAAAALHPQSGIGAAVDASSIPAALADEALELLSDYSTRWRLATKRIFDVAVCAAALLVLFPLFLVIAAAIKLTDGGPVFFGQRRVGFRRQTFRMLKFRSMVLHAEALKPRLQLVNESNGPVFKMRRDPRVTRVGRLLRKYSLDELPQLINVLRGDMSLVGPRPSLETEVARYEAWHFRRFAVRPGLTCLWQVIPDRYGMPFNDWMRLDAEYVDRWSLGLDVGLIMRTFRVVFGGTGQ